ncbi:MAG: hypothetical protein ACP6KW_07410 [Candidatus Thorarchaeota archaeon]
MSSARRIGTLREWSLHADLKRLYQKEGARAEVDVDGFIVDVVHDDMLIEIQTRGFTSIKDKLIKLMRNHNVRLVHPIAITKTIVRESVDGSTVLSRRKSPKRGGPQNIFDELVSIPTLIHHQNFSIEVLLTEEEEVRRHDGKGSWRRRGWSIVDRRLVSVQGRRLYRSAEDFLHFIPISVEDPFTNADLIAATGYSRRVVQRMTYCLRKMAVLRVVGKRGRANLYERKVTSPVQEHP